MLDTYFIVLFYSSTPGGYLIIFLHGGLIEVKGCNFDIVRANKRDVLRKLKELAKDGKIHVAR
jgi:hypothetical protein